jgi:hypothetical protein
MPTWFISAPLNFAPFPTGMLLMPAPLPTWQVSQGPVVGM